MTAKVGHYLRTATQCTEKKEPTHITEWKHQQRVVGSLVSATYVCWPVECLLFQRRGCCKRRGDCEGK